MQKPKILVTAATGKTGSAAAKRLLEEGFPVRAFVHRTDGRSDALAAAGAEIFAGGLEDPVDLCTAMAGVQRAYFCPPLEPGVLRKATAFAVAAAEARLELVVVLSQWLVDPAHLSIHAREKFLAGSVFAWTPHVASITINPGWFADNYLTALESVSQFGLLAMPLGHGLNAPPSSEDVGRVVAGALMQPEALIGKSFRPTGPDLLTPEEIAAAFGRVLARKVRYQNAPMTLFLKFARSTGLSDYLVAQLHSFLLDYQRGSFGIGAPTGVVLEIAGVPPESFESIVRRHAALSPLSQRSAASWTTAVWHLARALVTPAPDLRRLAEAMGHPTIAHATLAADSASWRASHT